MTTEGGYQEGAEWKNKKTTEVEISISCLEEMPGEGRAVLCGGPELGNAPAGRLYSLASLCCRLCVVQGHSSSPRSSHRIQDMQDRQGNCRLSQLSSEASERRSWWPSQETACFACCLAPLSSTTF